MIMVIGMMMLNEINHTHTQSPKTKTTETNGAIKNVELYIIDGV